MNEALHIHGLTDGNCEIHDWDMARMKRDFVRLLRERHGRGGLTVCVPCVDRFHALAKAEVEAGR